MAISTHISVSEWAKEDDRTIATAWELLRDAEKQSKTGRTPGSGGPQYSG